MPPKKTNSTRNKRQPESSNQDSIPNEPADGGRTDEGATVPETLKHESELAEPGDSAGQAKDAQNSRLTASWYGTWPKLSRESVLLESNPKETVSTEMRRAGTPQKQTAPRRTPLISPGSSARSLPLVATITKLNISSESSKSKESSKDEEIEEARGDAVAAAERDGDALPNADRGSDVSEAPRIEPPTGIMTPTSWLSWPRADKPILPSLSLAPISAKAESITAPLSRSETTSEAISAVKPSAAGNAQDSTESQDSMKPSDPLSSNVVASWYPRWVLGGSSKADPVEATTTTTVQSTVEEPQDVPQTDATQDTTGVPVEVKRSSWAFWSNSSIQGTNASGQMAVADSTSLASQQAVAAKEDVPVSNIDDKRKRPLSQGEQPARKKQAPSASSSSLTPKKVEEKVKEVENILLPSFESTYSVQPGAASIWQQIGNWIYTIPASKHPILLKEPRKIKHALAIGVHGYFPATIVQTVIGKPTGTSIKFAESAAKAIEAFTKKQGYSLQSIDKIALEGEGRIDERLDILWKLLLNWIDMIRRADFILVACHSQGVPVAISLVSKLIGFGCVSEARISICAMAGISRGPFAEYKSRWIGGSAAELFDFSDPTSSVSRTYKDALETVVKFGVKVVFIGSLDDQLVPLYSSTFTHVEHPNIYRAVFVDGRIHVADFISHLVGFALKLRNLGTSDHGLIRELSNPLAGSLVGGEGHSRIYDDPAVYSLTIDFALRTSDVTGTFEVDDTPSQITVNPYILPFAMRGVLEEDVVRKELSEEVIDLLKQFDRWKPSTKVLRDVKYRLEGVRSKL